MSETSKNIPNDDFNLSDERSEYENLINRLQKIKTTISLLEKTIFK